MMTSAEIIAIVQAAENGAEIERRYIGDDTWVLARPDWNFADFYYRIKLQPKRKIKLYATVDMRSGSLTLLKYSGDWREDSPFVRLPHLDCEVEE